MQITIVIPCYNEAGRLKREKFLAFAKQQPSINFLFINDGSKDETLSILSDMAEECASIQFLDLKENGGKAKAVQQGMLYAQEQGKADYIAFWDADLATPLYEIFNFTREISRGDFDMVIGLRLARLGALVKRKNSRHLLGRCFATVASFLLKLPVYDTQCGAKMFKSEVVNILFEEDFITRWLFDVEIITRYTKYFGEEKAKNSIYEYPLLEWNDVDGSRLKFRDFIKAPIEMLKIRRKY